MSSLYKPNPAMKWLRKQAEQEKGIVKPYWCPKCEKQVDALIIWRSAGNIILGCPICKSTEIEAWDSEKSVFNPSRR